MAKQIGGIETLRQAAGLKTTAAEKFILDSKSNTKMKISPERSISKSTKDNLKSKRSVLKKQMSKIARCNKAYAVTIKKQAVTLKKQEVESNLCIEACGVVLKRTLKK